MPETSTRQRAEPRFPLRLFVRLYPPDNSSFEIAQTIDISRHGARLASRRFHAPNQHLLVRSLRGNLSSYARVVHCQAINATSYSLGLELYNPIGDWSSPPPPPSSPKAA